MNCVGIPYLNKEIYEIKSLAGSHSEMLAQLVRQGIIFGVYTLVVCFFIRYMYFFGGSGILRLAMEVWYGD